MNAVSAQSTINVESDVATRAAFLKRIKAIAPLLRADIECEAGISAVAIGCLVAGSAGAGPVSTGLRDDIL
jgi:hypothetical protein